VIIPRYYTSSHALSSQKNFSELGRRAVLGLHDPGAARGIF